MAFYNKLIKPFSKPQKLSEDIEPVELNTRELDTTTINSNSIMYLEKENNIMDVFDFQKAHPDKMTDIQQKMQHRTFHFFLWLGVLGIIASTMSHHFSYLVLGLILTVFLGIGNKLTRPFRKEKAHNRAHAMFRGFLDGVTQYCSRRTKSEDRFKKAKIASLDFEANPHYYHLSHKISNFIPFASLGIFGAAALTHNPYIWAGVFYSFPIAWIIYKFSFYSKFDEKNLHPNLMSAWADGIGRGISKFYYYLTKTLGFLILGAMIFGAVARALMIIHVI